MPGARAQAKRSPREGSERQPDRVTCGTDRLHPRCVPRRRGAEAHPVAPRVTTPAVAAAVLGPHVVPGRKPRAAASAPARRPFARQSDSPAERALARVQQTNRRKRQCTPRPRSHSQLGNFVSRAGGSLAPASLAGGASRPHRRGPCWSRPAAPAAPRRQRLPFMNLQGAGGPSGLPCLALGPGYWDATEAGDVRRRGGSGGALRGSVRSLSFPRPRHGPQAPVVALGRV